MLLSEAHDYVTRSKRRIRVLGHLDQPLTAKQLARGIELPFDTVREILRDLASAGLVRCLNASARRSRLYWLTNTGKACLRHRCQALTIPQPSYFFPDVDWRLYGWVCYSHRAMIIKTLTQPMQPADIKRKARSRQGSLRMSANNVRDVMRLFLERGIVQIVPGKPRAHRRYELTAQGRQFQALLWRAEVPG